MLGQWVVFRTIVWYSHIVVSLSDIYKRGLIKAMMIYFPATIRNNRWIISTIWVLDKHLSLFTLQWFFKSISQLKFSFKIIFFHQCKTNQCFSFFERWKQWWIGNQFPIFFGFIGVFILSAKITRCIQQQTSNSHYDRLGNMKNN